MVPFLFVSNGVEYECVQRYMTPCMNSRLTARTLEISSIRMPFSALAVGGVEYDRRSHSTLALDEMFHDLVAD